MKIRVSRIEIFAADIPFKRQFSHSLHTRHSSESIFVKVVSDSGIAGFGESLPRPYVTGETQDSVIRRLKEAASRLSGRTFSDIGEAAAFCRDIDFLSGAARCAAELAVLDCAGKAFNTPISNVLGGVRAKKLRYSAVLGREPIARTAFSAFKFRLYGFSDIKLKVGNSRDLRRLSVLRSILGRSADIRLDANGAWSAGEAIEKLRSLGKRGFSVIEQPVPKSDIEGMKAVTDAIPQEVMADESLCSYEDAERLVKEKACGMFNIRLSKCGGLLESARIARLASESGIGYQIGCQVGETGLLSQAARLLASSTGGARYLEGSYAGFLLTEELTRGAVSFGYGGAAETTEGPGLGVELNESALDKYSVKTETIEL